MDSAVLCLHRNRKARTIKFLIAAQVVGRVELWEERDDGPTDDDDDNNDCYDGVSTRPLYVLQ